MPVLPAHTDPRLPTPRRSDPILPSDQAPVMAAIYTLTAAPGAAEQSQLSQAVFPRLPQAGPRPSSVWSWSPGLVPRPLPITPGTASGHPGVVSAALTAARTRRSPAVVAPNTPAQRSERGGQEGRPGRGQASPLTCTPRLRPHSGEGRGRQPPGAEGVSPHSPPGALSQPQSRASCSRGSGKLRREDGGRRRPPGGQGRAGHLGPLDWPPVGPAHQSFRFPVV